MSETETKRDMAIFFTSFGSVADTFFMEMAASSFFVFFAFVVVLDQTNAKKYDGLSTLISFDSSFLAK